MRRVRIIGIGPGHPDQVTAEAVRAMNEVAYFLVPDKSADHAGTDGLLRAREEICRRHLPGEYRVVTVRDPERDRDDPSDYRRAVEDWHEARAAAYEQAMLEHPGDVGFLVWGDPSLYDSTIRVVERVLARGNVSFDYDVIPGVSSLQLLAARHRLVLNDIGTSLTVTTGRRLPAEAAAGNDNLVVMLDGALRCRVLPDLSAWHIWWGANLGSPEEAVASGPLDQAMDDIVSARTQVKATAGWVMDTYLLRRTPAPRP
ncbi:precorrin-6A synthase (deacetylating) [Actinocorallia populi]|uniref:precorrin-6A synthase (deacetylating) n=1 Tax=Actinocorallia populi TaxID=2079200 RepID=UPI000D08BDD9|nr:precorrin-6A synthase (deacetylating) [Actinocorallia populi]